MLPTYLFICPSARLSASQRKLTYPITYSVQRTAYRYVPRRYIYLPSFSPYLITRPSLPSSPIPSLPSPLLSSSPSSSSFYSSTPRPTRIPEGVSSQRRERIREGTIRGLGWCWRGGGGTGEAFGGRRYRGAFVLHCVRVLAGVPYLPSVGICTYCIHGGVVRWVCYLGTLQSVPTLPT